MMPIYLDYNATTPTDPRVIEAMLPFLTKQFGNPANTLHSYGWAAETAVHKATDQVCKLLHCDKNEITWNSGATEGNNSVFWGLYFHSKKQQPQKPVHYITTSIEHASVINTLKKMKEFLDFDYSVIPVDEFGFIQMEELEKAVRPETLLLSVMWVNNEIGTIQDIEQLGQWAQSKNIYFHSDATQAAGKIKIDLKKHPIHFLTVSSHKMYGPKGVGFLFVRSKDPYVEIESFVSGGSHQNGRRAGTLNVPSIVGAGLACELAHTEFENENLRNRQLQQLAYQQLKSEFPNLRLNGPTLESGSRSPINLSLTFTNYPIDLYLNKLSGVAFSQGSACRSGQTTVSPVLSAIGLNYEQASQTVRLSLGKYTTETEILDAVRIFKSAFKA